jgi:hypothetical protein
MFELIIKSMSEQDQKAFKMYGKIPGKNLLTKMQKVSLPARLRYHPLTDRTVNTLILEIT